MVQTKALYNLLRLNAAEDQTLAAKPWAIEDLRAIPQSELFSRLAKKDIRLDKGGFIVFAENCDTPEELADLLLPDEVDEESYDALYLVIFELWRRLLPEKQSLSIFCDELDCQIAYFDEDREVSDEPLQDALSNLLEILDENADAGVEPHNVFAAISEYCAHDLESFIYDYIADLLDCGNPTYAEELIEGFSPYLREPASFDFLKARLVSFTDTPHANRLIRKILENENALPELIEILAFLAENGDHDLFVSTVKKIFPFLKTEEEFLELLEIAGDYYRRLDQDGVEQSILKLIKKRENRVGSLSPTDPDLKALLQIMAKSH
ncbi:MAG: hypothetical protein V4487_06530 [Chlamydiota bacterium]